MENQERQSEQQHPRKDASNAEYFWDYRGIDFAKQKNRQIYQPVSNRPDHQRQDYTTNPIIIRNKRDFLDWASVVTGWIISLATFTVLAMYTYYTRGQWHELIRGTDASTKAAQTAACALEENKRQFLTASAQNQRQFAETLGQMKAQIGVAQTANTLTQLATEVGNRPWIEIEGNLRPEDIKISNGLIGGFTFKFGNYGRSPALGFFRRPHFIFVDTPVPYMSVFETTKVCEKADDMSTGSYAWSRKRHGDMRTIAPGTTGLTEEAEVGQDNSGGSLSRSGVLIGCLPYDSPFQDAEHSAPYHAKIMYFVVFSGSAEKRQIQEIDRLDPE